MTTKEIETIAYNYLWKKGVYMCFEVACPISICSKRRRERVDLLLYETKGNWKCYEIKVSKSDFHSTAALSWYGNYNYYIMPYELYIQVKEEVPNDIGVFVAYDGSKRMECVKKPKRKELLCSHEDMMFSLMQGLSREYKKFRKIKDNQVKKNK